MKDKKRVVLKFGGSVLHSPSDLAGITREILEFVVNGYEVVAVVSAYFGVTEELLAQANKKGFDSSGEDFSELIASGELRAASELETYLIQHGSIASRKTPKELGFIAVGKRDSATPLAIDGAKIKSALAKTPIVIVPGFSAVDEAGECVLLGRGGSDISAVFIAQALGLDSVRLFKDVDGLYDSDPNKFEDAARLEYVDFDTASDIGGELIQLGAIAFAASKNVCIDIAAIGKSYSSRIGPVIPVTHPAPKDQISVQSNLGC